MKKLLTLFFLSLVILASLQQAALACGGAPMGESTEGDDAEVVAEA